MTITYRSPGRRAVAADLYRFAPRQFEEHLTGDATYRALHRQVNDLQWRLTEATRLRLPSRRVERLRVELTAAQTQQLQYLLRNPPPDDPIEPVELRRELDANGNLIGEVEGTPDPFIRSGAGIQMAEGDTVPTVEEVAEMIQ